MHIVKSRIMNDFIEPNRIQYSIPVYQRNYEWSKEQCIKLFEDIVLAYKKEKPHFCGSIVYSSIDLGKKISNYVVIDGQQRMTTIYLLIKALLDCAIEDAEKDTLKKVLFNEDKFKKYDIDDSTKLKLKPVKDDNKQLLLLMENKYDQIKKDTGIWNNYELFKSLITKELENGLSVGEIYEGIEWLTVADIRLEGDDQPQEIFERINSTGVPLSLSDKIRNFILMVDSDQERLYEDYWIQIEEDIQRDQMNGYFLTYLNLKMDGFPREDEAYDSFKELFFNKKYTNETMLKELVYYAKFYCTFLYGSSKYSKEVNEYLEALRKLKQTTMFVFLLNVFDDFENGILNEKELLKVLQFLQNYGIRRIVCEVNSNSLRGLYKTLYTRVYSNEDNKNHYYDALISFFKQLTSRDALIDDATYISALKTNNLYRKNALCKFLLTAIENQGKEKLITSNLTIEHIMPQNKNLSTSWQEMLGDNWQNVHEKYIHTLGNLTLTGYNSELGDKPFLTKKQMLEDAETKIVKLYSDVKSTEVWDEEHIKSRADRLVKEILALFPIEEPKNLILFKDIRFNEYTCENPENAHFKYPNYYVFCGERVIVNNYSDMLKSVVTKFYNLNPSIIKQMARNNTTMGSWSKVVLFSYDKEKIKYDYMIPGTNIYQNTGFNSWYSIQFIKALIEQFDLEYDDFVYSARSTNKEDNQNEN